jgi:hypothetical protein
VKFLNKEIRKFSFWGFAWTFTLINFTAFIVSRNQFWLTHPGQAWLAAGKTENRTYLASEFARDLSCYQPQTCLRSGASFISQPLITITTKFAELVTVDLNFEQRSFIILFIGLLWRITCVAILFISIKFLLETLNSTLRLFNLTLLLLGGLPLWSLGKILTNLPFGFDDAFILRANAAFYFMSFQDLMFYDFGFIAIIPGTMALLSKNHRILHLKMTQYLVLGFFVSMFYEVFVPLVIVSLCIFSWRTTKKIYPKILMMLVGQLIWTLLRAYTVRFLEPSDPSSPYFKDTSLFEVLRVFRLDGIETQYRSLGSVFVQYALLIFLASCSAIIFSLLTVFQSPRKTLITQPTDTTLIAMSSVLAPTVLITIGTYLTPRLVEVGRQSVGLTVAIVIYSYVMTESFSSKARAEGAAQRQTSSGHTD